MLPELAGLGDGLCYLMGSANRADITSALTVIIKNKFANIAIYNYKQHYTTDVN